MRDFLRGLGVVLVYFVVLAAFGWLFLSQMGRV